MKRIVTILLCAAVLMATLTCAGFAEDTIKIGFCNYTDSSPFSLKIHKQMELACAERGWELDVTENLGDAVTLMQCLDSYFLKDVDIIVAFYIDSALAPNAQTMCNDAGVPLIFMGCEPEGSIVVSADNTEFGRIVGEALGKAVLEHWEEPIDSILMVENAMIGELNTLRMTSALDSLLKTIGKTEDDVEVVFVDEEQDTIKATQHITDAFSAHPYWERTAVVCFSEEFGLSGAVNAVVSEDLGDKVLVSSVQGYTELLYNALHDYDWVAGGAEHFAAGFVSVIMDLCEQIASGTMPEPGIYPVPIVYLDRANCEEYSYTD